tara:strand:+ start:657 stop:1823 length:1167 start_codon:yes stop_codon:yes gene_type:complete
MTNMRAVIIGGAMSGNQGAHLMVHQVTKLVLEREGSAVTVLSQYAKIDAGNESERVTIANGSPLAVFPTLFLLSLTYRAIQPLRPFLIRKSHLIRNIVNSNVALDVSGISFVSGRTGPLIYNTAVLLPFFILGVPVVKLSQAMGPFTDPVTKFSAKYVLSKCAAVFARGEGTFSNVTKLDTKVRIERSPDLVFMLANSENVHVKGDGIAIIPSNVVKRKFDRQFGEGSYVALITATVNRLKLNHRIVILSFATLPGSGSHNNDSELCRQISSGTGVAYEKSHSIDHLIESLASCQIAVTGRFHGMIAALALGLPAIVTAWGHKYDEALWGKPFAVEVIDYNKLEEELLTAKISELCHLSQQNSHGNRKFARQLGSIARRTTLDELNRY